MKWPIVALDSIKGASKYAFVGGPFGSNLTTRDYVEGGVPVIRGNNLPANSPFLDDDFVFVSEEKADSLASNTAYPGDVVFTQRGTLGQVGVIPTAAKFPRYVISQSQMKLTVNPEKAIPEFVYYFFRMPSTVQAVVNHALTSGVPHINLGILKAFRVPLPPRYVQERIAATLLPYDKLIENNQRRITLLEEATTHLYREWFVRLRFPGHEHTHIANGVPDGWIKTHLEAACVTGNGIQTGPFGSQLHQSDYSDDGIPVVMPKDIFAARISTDSIARVPETVRDRLSRHVLQDGDIVLARRGDIGRKAFVAEREAGWLCGTGCMRLRTNQGKAIPRILFDTIGRQDVMGIIVGRAQGAIMPNLNLTILADVPIVLPPMPLQRQFMEYAGPIHRMIEVLAQQNEQLKLARNLLLPRLLRGEIAA